MTTIQYGGVTYKQVRHAIKCKKCEDTIESFSRHDFKYCSCGTVGIDGGIEAGNHLLGNLEDMENRSVYKAVIGEKTLWLPEEMTRFVGTEKLSPQRSQIKAKENASSSS
jgi:hypothetical protein